MTDDVLVEDRRENKVKSAEKTEDGAISGCARRNF